MPTNPEQTEADLPATCARRREFGCPLLCRSKNLQRIVTGGDQTIAFHSHPLIRVGGAVQIDPFHFHGSIAGRNNSGIGSVLQAICEAQHFLLLRRRKAADFVQDGFFETDAYALLDDTRVGRGKHVVCNMHSPSPAFRLAGSPRTA
jgi:hypothetical protein